MHVRVIVPPRPVVTLERAKAALRIEPEDTADNDLIEGYIAAATGWIDGPGGWLGRCLGEQTLELTARAFGNDRLPCPPAVEVTSIHFTDAQGAEQEMPSADYRLLANGSIWSADWPALGTAPDSVRVVYRAGYPDRSTPPAEEGGDPVMVSTVPEPICQAILLLVGQWFKTRENVITGTIATAMPFAVDALLAPYRVWR